MARKLSPLAAQITLDLNKWTAGIKQVERDSRAIAASLRPITDIGKQVGSAFAAAGAVVGGALLGLSKKAADFGDALLDASKRTGLTTQNLAGLKLLADQSGSSFEGLSKGVGQLSKNMLEAATKGGQSAKVFEAMGISVKDAGGQLRNASDVLPEIADRFAKMEDGSMKTALAMKLFGKAGADLIPLLNEGSAGFQRAREQADKFGIALTRAEAELGDKFNDSLEDSKAAMQGFANAIGVALLPKLTELVTKGNEWIAAASRWAKAHPELTMQIAQTSAVLFGTGGLILGLTAVATLAPRVYEGVMLITSGFVKLGGAAGLAKGGMIGVAAAISTAVNMLPKLALDKLVGQDFFKSAEDLGLKLRSIAGFSVSQFELSTSSKGVPGLPANWIELSTKAKDTTSDWEKEMQKLLGAMSKTDSAVDKAAESAKQFRESVDSIKGTIADTTPPSKELVTAIHELDAAGLMSSEAILNLAKDVGTLKNSKDPLIQQYVRMIPLMQLAARSAEMEVEQLQLIAEAAQNRPELDFSMLPTPDLSGLEHMKPLEAGDLLQAEAVTRVEDLNAELKEMRATVPAVERAVRLLKNEGKSNAEIMALMGREMESAARTAKQLNIPLGEVTRTILNQQSRIEDLRNAWGATFANISDRLVDMVADFDFSFRRLADIAKDTAKSLMRSFLDGFFKPFKDQLAGLGESLASALSGVLFGGGGGTKGGVGAAVGGALGVGGKSGVLGAALSKIPGLGWLGAGAGTAALIGTAAGIPPLAGSAAATAALSSELALGPALSSVTPLAGPAAGTGGAGAGGAAAGGFLSAAAPFLPFAGAAVAGAVAAFSNQKRDIADTWTPEQSEFDRLMENADSAAEKTDLAQSHLQKIYELAMKGSGHVTVAEQSLDTFKRSYGDPAQYGAQVDLPERAPGFGPLTGDVVGGSFSIGALETRAMESSAASAANGGINVAGDIVLNFDIEDVDSPEEWIGWFKLNKAGIREEIVRGVLLTQGAVVSR